MNEIVVSAETYDWLLAELERSPKELPKLKKLFSEKAPWESC